MSITNQQDIYVEEKEKLHKTINQIEKRLKTLDKVNLLPFKDKNKTFELEQAIKQPYFGRIDFKDTNYTEVESIYIGKTGLHDDMNQQVIIVDWRAPIASVFYSFNGGSDLASYKSPDGIIEIEIYIKRNFDISNKELKRVVDTYVKGENILNVNDEYLLYKLKENKDNRLNDIVSTIQKEQDKIIRSEKNKAIIIQGVAGSGKTTVALHRLAYLLYNYRENIRSEQMVIFAPNNIFLDYISNVLPELGVGDIQQTTFDEWVLSKLGDEVVLNNTFKDNEKWYELGKVSNIENKVIPVRFKGSYIFYNWVNECLNLFERYWIPNSDIKIDESLILKKEVILEWYNVDYKQYPLIKRRERVIARIEKWIKLQLKEQVNDLQSKKNKNNKTRKIMNEYIKLWPKYTPLNLYKVFLSRNNRPQFLSMELLNKLPNIIVDNFIDNEIKYEDLAPILHIHNRLFGIDEYLHHVVIDEAQDFSAYQFAVLKEYTPTQSFTIFGDICQGIHYYKGIDKWDDVLQIFESEANYLELNRSYRSTIEIIDFSNKIIEKFIDSVTLAEPVFRSGEKVNVIQTNKLDRENIIVKSVIQLLNKSSSVAVLGRTSQHCEELYTFLKKAGLEANLIHSEQNKFHGGLSILPIYLSKGLEFDSVLVADVDNMNYEFTSQDAKLLYVGCTRALHNLWLTYSKEISSLLRDIIE